MLFKNKERTRTEPKMYGESEFAFYDTSARRPFAIYRNLVNSWLEPYPSAERVELMRRLRLGNDAQYGAAFAELMIFIALYNLGHNVEVHPDCPHESRHPDFLVRRANGSSIAYVEVTTFGHEDGKSAQDRREAVLINRLQKIALPSGWRIAYRRKKAGPESPNSKRLAHEVLEWAQSVGADETTMHRRKFTAGDWQIDLTLMHGFPKDQRAARNIAAYFGGAHYIAPHLGIRDALEEKGQRYSIKDTPYLIVVADCRGELFSAEGVRDTAVSAIFGILTWQVQLSEDEPLTGMPHRASDGYWGTPAAPRHQNVSAVLVMPRPELWGLRTDGLQPLMVSNPFATNPLPSEVLPLPGLRYVSEIDELEPTAGTFLADMLRLPAEWPPEE